MPNLYIDRGIIKWAAFDALNGYHSMLKEMQHRLGKKAKPILSDDDYEILNRNIQEAIINKKEIELKYYNDGYIKVTYGMVKKLDYVSKTIILSTLEKIPAEDIICVETLS
ncbi:MAG: YolD-like family protein [Candidatus Izemoplasmatales bacterium]|nr:YolD-like family protein [Candidatus Izemoplasmatales bacterium]